MRDGDDVHYVGYWGASAVSFLPPEGIVEYMGSADRFARLDAHPFVEGNDGFRAWMSVIHDCAGEVLEQKLRAAR